MFFVDACGVNAAEDMLEVFPLLQAATLVIFVSSTQGNGELPSLGRKFFSILFDKNGNILSGKDCAVLGFGNSSYPIFCGAASQLSKMLAKVDAREVVPRGQCDSVKGEGPTFHDWTTNLVMEMASMRGASHLMLKLSSNMEESTASSLVRARNMVTCVKVEVFSAKEVEIAAAMSYMTKRRGSMGTISRRNTIDSSGSRTSVGTSGRRTTIDSFGCDAPCDMKISVHNERVMQIIASSSTHFSNKDILEGRVKSRTDVISSVVGEEGSDAATRKTSLVKIDLQSCGCECYVPITPCFLAMYVLMNDASFDVNLDPPYQPGDHIRVFPRNVVSLEQVQVFVRHISRGEAGADFCLQDHIFVSFDNENVPRSELTATWPLLNKSLNNLMPLGYFFANQVALESPISMQACLDLSQLATSAKDKAVLEGIGNNNINYENFCSVTGLKWIDLFDTFRSLRKRVTINFLICNMKPNHARSYSIASSKDVVGSELHIVVGR